MNNEQWIERKKTNPKQQYLKVAISRSVMLHSAKSALIQPCSLDNTKRLSSAWESFNIR